MHPVVTTGSRTISCAPSRLREPKTSRSASGRRVYGPAEKRTLAFIRRSRDLGFTLEEIRALLALGGPERASCADVHKIAGAHLASVRRKLSDLVKLESILAETVAQCSDGATPRLSGARYSGCWPA